MPLLIPRGPFLFGKQMGTLTDILMRCTASNKLTMVLVASSGCFCVASWAAHP